MLLWGLNMRVIATRTDASWGLEEQEEFISTDEQLKVALLDFGWVKPYDDTKPLPPKGLNVYEPGMSYGPGRFVIKNDSLRISNCKTSNTWVESEWDSGITGSNAN